MSYRSWLITDCCLPGQLESTFVWQIIRLSFIALSMSGWRLSTSTWCACMTRAAASASIRTANRGLFLIQLFLMRFMSIREIRMVMWPLYCNGILVKHLPSSYCRYFPCLCNNNSYSRLFHLKTQSWQQSGEWKRGRTFGHFGVFNFPKRKVTAREETRIISNIITIVSKSNVHSIRIGKLSTGYSFVMLSAQSERI